MEVFIGSHAFAEKKRNWWVEGEITNVNALQAYMPTQKRNKSEWKPLQAYMSIHKKKEILTKAFGDLHA